MKRYLLFAAHAYAYEILRPLQAEIRRQGHECAWWLEPTCPDRLTADEQRLTTRRQVKAYAPLAVFVPGNYVYPDFPGIKVEVFHGYAMRKRIEAVDDHFAIRGWFDIYCTQGPSSTPYFQQLGDKHKYFKIYETGWPKMDPFFAAARHEQPTGEVPTILYAPTFSRGITSVEAMLPVIDALAAERPWRWIITFHPKITDPKIIKAYEELDARHPNVDFQRVNRGLETFVQTDAMLCDSSSITVEYMMLGKPVVTYRNTHPGPHLIDCLQPAEVGPALERALTHPAELMNAMAEYTAHHEAHRDGLNSRRVLEAVDHFVANHLGHMPRKPLNLLRRLKLYL